MMEFQLYVYMCLCPPCCLSDRRGKRGRKGRAEIWSERKGRAKKEKEKAGHEIWTLGLFFGILERFSG